MKAVFLSDSMGFSGGRKLLLEYAAYMKGAGHDVDVLVLDPGGPLSNLVEARRVPSFNRDSIPACDAIVASKPQEVLDAWLSGRGKAVHFCQSYEVAELEQHLCGAHGWGGLGAWLKLQKRKLTWRSRRRRFDKIYQLPTELLAVSKSLKDQLEGRYGRGVRLVLNGVRTEFFHAPRRMERELFSEFRPMRVLSIGPADVSFKGIDQTIEAVRIAKGRGLPIKFLRVSPSFSKAERENPMVDEFYEALDQARLGDLIRFCDVFVSNSTEGEGFGLPAMEALSCGAVCVLSSISSYLNFSERRDFCLFVPPFDPKATADAMERIYKASSSDLIKMRTGALEVASIYKFDRACRDFEKTLLEIAAR